MTLPESLRAEMEEKATRIANEAAMPMLRDMYPSRSRGQMANEFRHFVLEGVYLCYAALTRTTPSADDERDAEKYAMQWDPEHKFTDLSHAENAVRYRAFLAGRAGMVPRAEYEKLKIQLRREYFDGKELANKVAEAVQAERERLSEEFFLEVITRWKFQWMDVKGTDEKDRKNYNRRAFGVDANMKYSLARMLVKAIDPDPKEGGE